MKTITALVFITGVVMISTSCKKNKDDNPAAPVIEFKEISGSTVEQFNNHLRISISYEDYQGDLGEVDPDNYSLKVKDSRLADADWYHIPPMTPDMQELHIKGTYTIDLDPLFLLGSGTQEQTRFSIEIRDRNGNWSNTVETPNVLIVDSL